MSDDLLSGLNSLVNAADKPAQKQKPLPQTTPAGKRDPQPAADAESPLSFEGGQTQQILDRLDGIRAAIDGLRQGEGGEAQGQQVAKPQPATQAKPPALPKPAGTPAQSGPLQAASYWPYVILVSAALELAAFALGMGYGAIVASGKFPYWYKPGMSGALVDWVAAPAGVLLLPIMAGLLVLGGRELQREGRDTAAKAVWAVAGTLALVSLVIPFIA